MIRKLCLLAELRSRANLSQATRSFFYRHHLELPKSGDVNKVKLEVATKDMRCQ